MHTNNTSPPMRSVWLSLFWKEWREQRWKLLVLSLLIFVLPGVFLLDGEQSTKHLLEVTGGTLLAYCVLAALFVGMGAAADERQRGTIRFLRTLPVSTIKPALAKSFVSWLVLCIPILLVGIACWMLSPPQATLDRIELLETKSLEGISLEEQQEWLSLYELHGNISSLHSPFLGMKQLSNIAGWLTATIGLAMLFATSLFLWMAACGVDRSDEVRAGAIGLLITVVLWGILAGLFNLADDLGIYWLEQSLAVPLSAAPGAIAFLRPVATDMNWIIPFPLLATLSVIAHLALFLRYVTKFGSSERPTPKHAEPSAHGSSTSIWLGKPFPSQAIAIAWKQLHETGPLAIIAAVAVLGMAMIGYWTQNSKSSFHNEFSEILSAVTVSVGFLVTIVAGIGVFLEDMRPQVGAFWRSRPIRFQQWFWIKYFVGLLVLVASFGTLLLLAYAFVDQRTAANLLGSEFLEAATTVSLIFLLLYTLSIATYGWTRHPVLAAMLTIVLFFLGAIAVQLVCEHRLARDASEMFGFAVLGVALVAAVGAAMSAVSRGQSLRG